MNPSARNQTLSKGGRLYPSKAGWYSLRYPRSWVAEDSEDCTTFSDPENGVGALQISAYETPTHQDSKDILVEFLSDNQIPLDETKLAYEKNEGRCTASYSYSQGPWFKRIWFVSESNRLLMITYTTKVGDHEKEDKEVEEIIHSVVIEPRAGTERNGENRMKGIAKLVIVMTVFNVVAAFGQTRAELEAKFGQPVNAYSVGESVWMSPEYASDGQVCRMIFYPRRFSSTTNYLTNPLPFDEFRSIIDLIVPVAIRGAQKEPFGNGLWNIGGGVRWTNFVYERVTIEYVAGVRFNTALGMGELVDLSSEEVSKQQPQPKPIKEDFSLYSGSTAEIVTVQWNDRKCP